MPAQRRVIGTEAVTEAHRRGQRQLEVLPEDIVTALALESAQRLGIELVDGPLATTPPPLADSATRTQRSLYRRSPRWHTRATRTTHQWQPLNKLALVGAGGVGCNIAHLAANSNLARHIELIDITPGLAAATALDLHHAAGISVSAATLNGGTELSAVAGADVVVVTAGRPRTPGMTRNDLLELNHRVIRTCASTIATAAPEAVVIVVTNPLDEMTLAMLQETEFPRERVLGMAGTLDSARFRVALAAASGCRPGDVEALTLGSHGDEMVPVTSLARIKGRPVTDMLDDATLQSCVNTAVGGGGAVVALRKTGSATIAPAHAVIEVLEHMCGIRRGWVPVSIQLQGEYGFNSIVMGVPVHLGATGMTAIETLPLNTTELAALQQAAARCAAQQGITPAQAVPGLQTA